MAGSVRRVNRNFDVSRFNSFRGRRELRFCVAKPEQIERMN